MGLAERRAVGEFLEKTFPAWVKKINEAVGIEVKVTVDWDKIAADDYSHLYEDAFTKVYFTPLVDGLKEICKDKMGKEALQAALKEVVITNTKNYYYGDCWTFADGIITIDHSPISNTDHIEDRTKGLVAVLEKSL